MFERLENLLMIFADRIEKLESELELLSRRVEKLEGYQLLYRKLGPNPTYKNEISEEELERVVNLIKIESDKIKAAKGDE